MLWEVALHRDQEYRFWGNIICTKSLVLPIIICITLEKFLSVSVPQFLPLYIYLTHKAVLSIK